LIPSGIKLTQKCLTLTQRQAARFSSEAAVKPEARETFKAQEFAKVAGVTVRALHHYDRLGLLKPKHRSSAGYRLYSVGDFARLEQIVVLKFLGMPLQQIKRLLTVETGLADALRRQRHVLMEKRIQLDRAIHAIGNAQSALAAKATPDWRLLQIITREIAMQNSTDWTKKYYSPEAQQKVEERRKLWSPELQERVSREWAQLFADIEAALGEDPAGRKAQELAARWKKLVEEFTGGDREIRIGLNKMWADQANWVDQQARSFKIKPEVQEFILRAIRAGK
jgi:MerR family transcriptional regulator, thiopeptide resistance regulator